MRYLGLIILLISISAPAEEQNRLTYDGEYRIKSKFHLIDQIHYKDEFHRAVIEVPAGTTEKWEVVKDTGHLEWEFKKGKPRKVKYLGYPGNYGFIPQTRFYDGDTLDVIVLDSAVDRGTVHNIKVIGALKLLDKGKIDHKIIAVPMDGPFKKIDSIGEMVRKYPGVIHIVRLWFEGYKDPGKIQFLGYMKESDAINLIEESHNNWVRDEK